MNQKYRNHQEEIDALNATKDNNTMSKQQWNKRDFPSTKEAHTPLPRQFTDDEQKRGRETPAIRATPREPKYTPPPMQGGKLITIIVHTPTGPIDEIRSDRLIEILQVAINQSQLEWDMDSFHDAVRLLKFLRRQT